MATRPAREVGGRVDEKAEGDERRRVRDDDAQEHAVAPCHDMCTLPQYGVGGAESHRSVANEALR